MQVRRYKARKEVPGRKIESISGRETWDLRKMLPKRAAARVEYDVGEGALHPGSVGPIWRAMIRKAFERGALMDLTIDDVTRLLKGISAHSTRVGLTQDMFVSGEDLAGIMDAGRWKWTCNGCIIASLQSSVVGMGRLIASGRASTR